MSLTPVKVLKHTHKYSNVIGKMIVDHQLDIGGLQDLSTGLLLNLVITLRPMFNIVERKRMREVRVSLKRIDREEVEDSDDTVTISSIESENEDDLEEKKDDDDEEASGNRMMSKMTWEGIKGEMNTVVRVVNDGNKIRTTRVNTSLVVKIKRLGHIKPKRNLKALVNNVVEDVMWKMALDEMKLEKEQKEKEKMIEIMDRTVDDYIKKQDMEREDIPRMVDDGDEVAADPNESDDSDIVILSDDDMTFSNLVTFFPQMAVD